MQLLIATIIIAYVVESVKPIQSGTWPVQYHQEQQDQAVWGKIKQMLGGGCTFRQIEEAIRKEGCDGASSTIRMYTTRERKLTKEAKADDTGPVEKIERKWLIRLLYKPLIM